MRLGSTVSRLSECYAIPSRICTCSPNSLPSPLIGLLPDDLPFAKHNLIVALDHIQAMAHSTKLGNHFLRYAIFNRDRAVEKFGGTGV